ncbi:glutathione S-transferase [Bombardia bombarda]|uniref:Glutathione S-transferase n=1 Tax=Bombardia bombarda TaxID=252184 RepID=A0AA39WH17_9PEZI|nr:glutathione S-transferase [Bombardia bombarda]
MADNSTLKPIKLYGHLGPNPVKVDMVLRELGLPFEVVDIEFTAVKDPSYTAINPNGRMPSIHDPNTGLTLWESGAILEYLVAKYDPEHKLSFPEGSDDFFLAKQWLHYQVSGQGPYYGQAVHFTRNHPEKVPSAVERYMKEINRVTAVIEGHLERQQKLYEGKTDGPWVVGNKMSYVDFAFVPWQTYATKFLEEHGFDENDYPLVKAWVDKLRARESVKIAMSL